MNHPINALPEAVADAIGAILDYLWDDEQLDFLACSDDRRAKHIFNHLAAIAYWLYDPDLTDKPGT